MSDDSAITKTLKEMAKLSILANRISEVQEKNMKAYPFIFFNEVKSVKVDYNLGRAHTKYAPGTKEPKWDTWVAYYLELNEGSNPNLERRFLCIEEAIRVLFWKDIRVEVHFNGKPMYKSSDV